MRPVHHALLWFASPVLVLACGGSGSTDGDKATDSTDASADSGADAASVSMGQGSDGSSGGGMAESGPGQPGSDAAATGPGGPADASYPPMLEAGAPTPIGDQTQPRKLTIENHCAETIWTFALPHTTFPGGVPLQVDPGQSFVVGWPNTWSGRIWGRTECTGSAYNAIKCAQTGNDTLAEFTLTAGMNEDWYDISLVDGFTLATGIIQVDVPWTPSPTYVPGGKLGADGHCGSPVCAVDLLANCPASQRKTDATGATSNVVTCVNAQNQGTPIQQYFKAGCPTSYSWPYDDPQSLFTCPDAAQNNGVGAKDYKVIFCPTQGTTPGFP